MEGLMQWAHRNNATKVQEKCNPVTVQMVMCAHSMQLSNDDPAMGNFNNACYKRAMYSVIEGDKNLSKKQESLLETISSLADGKTYSVTISSLPSMAQLTTRARTALEKRNLVYRVNSLGHALGSVIDEVLSSYRITTLTVGNTTLKAQWDGQFLVKINLRKSCLEVVMLKFNPEFEEADVNNLKNNNVTKELKKAMCKNLCRFQMSRQLCFEVYLGGLHQFSLCRAAGSNSSQLAVMVLESKFSVDFLQRHTLTNLPHKWNKWRNRADFLEGNPSRNRPCQIILGGDYRDLARLTGKLLQVPCGVSEVYKAGEKLPVQVHPCPPSKAEPGDEQNTSQHTGATAARPRPKKICGRKGQLRREILDTLEARELIEAEDNDRIYVTLENKEDETFQHPATTNNYLGKLGLHPCFEDYVNFKCTNATDLLDQLGCPLEAEEYALEKRSFGLAGEEYENLDVNTMTTAELLKLQKGKKLDVFYSFCRGNIETCMNTFHCSRCHQCAEWKEWHCENCDRCSYGLTMPKCGHCGNNARRGEPSVKPALEKRCLIDKLVQMLEVGDSDYAHQCPTLDDCYFMMLDSDHSSDEDESSSPNKDSNLLSLRPFETRVNDSSSRSSSSDDDDPLPPAKKLRSDLADDSSCSSSSSSSDEDLPLSALKTKINKAGSWPCVRKPSAHVASDSSSELSSSEQENLALLATAMALTSRSAALTLSSSTGTDDELLLLTLLAMRSRRNRKQQHPSSDDDSTSTASSDDDIPLSALKARLDSENQGSSGAKGKKRTLKVAAKSSSSSRSETCGPPSSASLHSANVSDNSSNVTSIEGKLTTSLDTNDEGKCQTKYVKRNGKETSKTAGNSASNSTSVADGQGELKKCTESSSLSSDQEMGASTSLFGAMFSTVWTDDGQCRKQKPCRKSYDDRGWHFSDEEDDIVTFL